MEKGEIYQSLEEDFAATFIKELMPGILHNFANPLNGIMGRSKLLQRRIEDNVKKIEELYPEAAAAMINDLQKIRTDIRAINQETENFFDIFKDVAAKFYALATKKDDQINISELLMAEMRFANFYLDFKHEIKKDTQWDQEMPDIRGSKADLSLAFWRIIRFAMVKALDSHLKELRIRTDHDNEYVHVFIKSSGESISAQNLNAAVENLKSDCMQVPEGCDRGVFMSLLIFHQYSARINVFHEENFNTIFIGFPYHNERSKK